MPSTRRSSPGFDEAILLDVNGYVSEGSGENIFIVKKGVVTTPPLASSILAGITRDTVIKLCREEGIPLREERITRDELYLADEVFFTGTAAEVTPVREVDNRVTGDGMSGASHPRRYRSATSTSSRAATTRTPSGSTRI